MTPSPTKSAIGYEGFQFELSDERWLARVRSALHTAGSTSGVTAPAAAHQPANTMESRLGPYELIREIGEGGMGTVWLARRADGLFERNVAVKFIKRGMDTDTVVRRFRNERHVLATLIHPNIAQLYDGGATLDGQPFLIMEYVEGTPILEYCENQNLDIDDRLRLFRKVCLAVHHAHRHLVLHRDVKPANILVAQDGTPKLLDFGIAKLVDVDDDDESGITATDHRPLTPRYASPEQVRAERLTTATDVYSLGVVLYELLTARPLYDLDSGSRHEVERAVLTHEPPRPSLTAGKRDDLPAAQRRQLQRRLRGNLDTITLTALNKDAADRYPSAEQLAEDIGRHLQGLPLLTRPPGMIARIVRVVRRRRVPLIAAATGGLLSLVLAGAFIVHQFLMPDWARTHLRDARMSIVGARTNHAMYNIIFFNAPDMRDPKRPRSAFAQLDEVLAKYQAAVRLAPGNAAIRLERDIVRIARTWRNEPAQLRDQLDSLRHELPLTCSYAEQLHASGARPVFSPDLLDQATAADLRGLGFLAMLWGDPETTIDVWTRLELTETDPLVEASLGNIYLALDLPQLAYPRLLSAHRAYPQAQNLTAYLADAAARCGDMLQARRLLETAARGANLSDASLPVERVRMLCLLAEGQTEAAIKLYHDAHLDSYNPVATVQLAEHFERLRQELMALQILENRITDRNVGQVVLEKFVRLTEAWWTRLPAAERARYLTDRVATNGGWDFATLLATYVRTVSWLEAYGDRHPLGQRAGWLQLDFPVSAEDHVAARKELLGLARPRVSTSGHPMAD